MTATAQGRGQKGQRSNCCQWTRRNKAKWLGHRRDLRGRARPADRPGIHRLMHLWRTGEETKVNAYIDDHGLGRHALFVRVLQALIELSPGGYRGTRDPRVDIQPHRCPGQVSAQTEATGSCGRKHRNDHTALRLVNFNNLAGQTLTPRRGHGFVRRGISSRWRPNEAWPKCPEFANPLAEEVALGLPAIRQAGLEDSDAYASAARQGVS